MQIDKLDSEIIKLLQKDGRMQSKAMSQVVGVTESTVRKRLARLIDNKVIQIVAVADPQKIGFQIVGSFKIHVDLKKMDNVIKEINDIDEIWYVAKATGSADIDTEFNVCSMKELNDLLYNRLAQIDGIIRTETSIIVGYEKRKYTWGVGEIKGCKGNKGDKAGKGDKVDKDK